MRIWILLLPLLTSCAAYLEAERRSWRKDGACAVVCDYRRGYLSAARTISPFACRCMTPEYEALNAMHSVPMVEPTGTERCCNGCVAEANAILKRQPWRRQFPDPFDDPLGDILKELRQELEQARSEP